MAIVPAFLRLGAAGASRDEAAARFADLELAYERYRLLVRRTAYSLGGAEDLDDIVQEVFVRLWKSGSAFRGDADPRTWVYRITVNTAREHWRKRGRYKAAIARYVAEPRAQSAQGGQGSWELSQALARGLQSLSPDQREAVTLCYLEELSLTEASGILDVPEGTLKSRLHAARKALAVAMGIKEDSHEG